MFPPLAHFYLYHPSTPLPAFFYSFLSLLFSVSLPWLPASHAVPTEPIAPSYTIWFFFSFPLLFGFQVFTIGILGKTPVFQPPEKTANVLLNNFITPPRQQEARPRKPFPPSALKVK